MIFVTIGTSEPFDRLISALDSLHTDEELVVQCGQTARRPARGECVDFMEFDRFVECLLRARVVVMHGGAGSVLVALMHEVRPVVMPRLAALGEAVDDHQVPFSRRLAERGLATLVEDAAGLREAVLEADTVADRLEPGRALTAELHEYLSSVVRGTPGHACPNG